MTATLTLARSEATQRLEHQLIEGQRLLGRDVGDRLELAKVAQDRSAWSLRNRQILFRLFEDNSGIAGYHNLAPLSAMASLPLQVEHFREEVRGQLACLQTQLERVS